MAPGRSAAFSLPPGLGSPDPSHTEKAESTAVGRPAAACIKLGWMHKIGTPTEAALAAAESAVYLLQRLGGTLRLRAGRIRVCAPHPIPDDLLLLLHEHRAAILHLRPWLGWSWLSDCRACRLYPAALASELGCDVACMHEADRNA